MKSIWNAVAITGLMILAASGCASASREETLPTERPPITPDVESEVEIADMPVETVEVRVQSPPPSTVEVVVMGTLADACTAFHDVAQSRDGSEVRLALRTERPVDLICGQEARPYERTITLDGTFEPGSYTVVANGVERAFEVGTSGGDGQIVEGLAFVDRVEVLLSESFPVQVTLAVSGWLPDGCTQLDRTEQERDDNTVEVTMTTRRTAGAVCTEAIVAFEESVRLDGAFGPGHYVVRVNEVEAALQVD